MKLRVLDPSLTERPRLQSSVALRAHALAEKCLSELTPGDIAFCLRQKIALPHVVPLALDLLDDNPIVEVEFYDGDLLVSLLLASKTHALTELETTRLWDACGGAEAAAKTLAEVVVPEVAAFRSRQPST